MSEPTSKAEVRPLTTVEGGVLHVTAVDWAANVLEKSLGIPLGAGRLIRDEVFRATYAGIEWVEAINQSSFKVAREVVKRSDKLSLEAIDGFELVLNALSRIVRGSGEAAGEMVAKTAASVIGKKEPAAKAV
jgi:hypothetical protein